jgi:hypothetical protein
MFDRYGTTEGSLEGHDLHVATPFPEELCQKKIGRVEFRRPEQ